MLPARETRAKISRDKRRGRSAAEGGDDTEEAVAGAQVEISRKRSPDRVWRCPTWNALKAAVQRSSGPSRLRAQHPPNRPDAGELTRTRVASSSCSEPQSRVHPLYERPDDHSSNSARPSVAPRSRSRLWRDLANSTRSPVQKPRRAVGPVGPEPMNGYQRAARR